MKDRTAWKFSFLVPEELSSVTLIFSEHCSFPRSWAVVDARSPNMLTCAMVRLASGGGESRVVNVTP